MATIRPIRADATGPDQAGTLVAHRIHSIRLRDRLRIPALRHDRPQGEQLCRDLRRKKGVTGARFNAAAASLTLTYRDIATQDSLGALLDSLTELDIRLAGDGGGGDANEPRSVKEEERSAPDPSESDGRGWHVKELVEVLELLQGSTTGLTSEEARARLERDGPNLLTHLERRSDWHILKEQFESAPVAMLGVSAAISLLTSAPLDAAVIVIVVGANAAIGFLTERQAEDTIASMATIEGQKLKVLRDGEPREVDSSDIVRGDILLLEPGVRLPADARLVKAHHLTVDESSLTGESLPVSKKARDCAEPRVLAERTNMVHLGTAISGGDGRSVVVDTGDETELGKIQSLASGSHRPMTPMQEQLGKVSTQLAVLSAAVCALVFAVGLLRGQSRLGMLNTAISLAVAAVPEGLPAISNSLLAIGVRRMREQNVLARNLDAIENLGSIDVLCVDKTGTLTENRMQVMEVQTWDRALNFAGQESAWREQLSAVDDRLWKVIALCNESTWEEGQWQGSPTENALAEIAASTGLNIERLRNSMPRSKTRYRSESRPYMVTSHSYPRKRGYFVAVKGRPRQVINRCTHLRQGGRRVPMTDARREKIMAHNRALMSLSYRVLGVAWRHQEDKALGKLESLEWLGLVAMADPLRPEVKELLPQLQEAGIRTIILTGDQMGTASAIGREAGLNGNADVRVMGAEELEQLSEGELLEEVMHTHVFARVSPAMKLKLVQVLQKSGHRVAMTGDGINDGPALRVADVGIAMGRNGSDVARSMSDVVLTDDRLQSIIDAMANGRASFANLQKAIEYLLSTNFSEIQVTLATIAAGLPSPLSPIQLLWINLVTDVFPALAIGFEEPEWDVLKQPPATFQQGVIDKKRLGELLRQSLVISGGTLASYLYGLGRYGIGQKANTQAFMTLTLAQLLQAYSSRTRSSSIYRPGGPPPNPLLKAAIGGSIGLQLATALPLVRRVFGVTPLGPIDMAVIAAGSIIPILINEKLKPLAGEGKTDG